MEIQLAWSKPYLLVLAACLRDLHNNRQTSEGKLDSVVWETPPTPVPPHRAHPGASHSDFQPRIPATRSQEDLLVWLGSQIYFKSLDREWHLRDA